MITFERMAGDIGARLRDLHMERIPKRVWLGGGAALALFGGVAAAGAGSLATHATGAEPELASREARLLRIETAPPPPLEAPSPVAEGERLAVLTDTPADLSNLDPDLQRSADYAALAASMRRYDAQLARDLASVDARPLPSELSIDVPSRPEPIVLHPNAEAAAPAAHADEVAASGDTSRAPEAEDD